MTFLILADAAADSGLKANDIGAVVSAIGSLGFAIWFAWHTTTTTLPNQQKEHRDAIKELNDSNNARAKEIAEIHSKTIDGLVMDLRQSRDSYLKEISGARDQYEKWKLSWHDNKP